MCDTHLKSKMILESAQMLANCFTQDRLSKADCPRTKKGTVWSYAHPNHPCTKWVKESRGNTFWLCEHALAMAVERRLRRPDYNDHHSIGFIRWVVLNINAHISTKCEMTPFAVAIGKDKNCRQVAGFNEMNVFDKYKLFIKLDKPFATWPEDRTPNWKKDA
jgi:hypothetical protein